MKEATTVDASNVKAIAERSVYLKSALHTQLKVGVSYMDDSTVYSSRPSL